MLRWKSRSGRTVSQRSDEEVMVLDVGEADEEVVALFVG